VATLPDASISRTWGLFFGLCVLCVLCG
jgi:hypothetical protein